MPILDVELVASDSSSCLPADLTQSLADAVAQVFGTPHGTVWVKVRVIPSTQYAEDNGTPLGVYPVFVTVLKSRVPEGSALENEIAQLLTFIKVSLVSTLLLLCHAERSEASLYRRARLFGCKGRSLRVT